MISFKTKSEEMFASYLDALDLKADYEKSWGTRNPDFTIYTDLEKKKVLLVTDVKDIEYNKKEKRVLLEKKMLSRTVDPYAAIRAKIKIGREQLKGAAGYPTAVILKSNIGLQLDPLIVISAMLGDLTLNFFIPGDKSEVREPTTSFGGRGRMIDPKSGKPQDTTISAIAILETIKPDVIKSKFTEKLHDCLVNFNIDNQKDMDEFFRKAKEIEKEMIGLGYDLEREATQVVFIINPLARLPFPKTYFKKSYTFIYEYDLKTEKFNKIYDWTKKRNHNTQC